MTSRLALAAALAFALAACGSDDAAEQAGDAAVEAVETAAPGPAESAAPAAEATPTDEASASPSPTPTASASAARATPTPTPVAAAGPPASFQQCAICHKVEPGQHGLGPSLAGVFGAGSAHAAGFNYSDAMEGANLTWNQGNLNRFLTNPQATVPGTTMAFAGVKDAAQRAEIIAYLKTL